MCVLPTSFAPALSIAATEGLDFAGSTPIVLAQQGLPLPVGRPSTSRLSFAANANRSTHPSSSSPVMSHLSMNGSFRAFGGGEDGLNTHLGFTDDAGCDVVAGYDLPDAFWRTG